MRARSRRVSNGGATTPTAREPDVAVAVGSILLDVDFRIDHPPELVDKLRELAARYARAVPVD